jgi:hypothetical protein
MQMINASFILPDVDHSAAEGPVAKDADAAIIERKPFPKGVGLPEHGQLFLRSQVSGRSHRQD